MKKILCAMLLAIGGCMTAMAGSDIKLSSGSLKQLKEGGVASLVIDMTDTKYDNKMPLRQDGRFAAVDNEMANYASEFIREFNDNSNKFRMTDKADESQYEIIVQITNLDTFIHMMSFKGGIGIKLWGAITIKNKVSNENVAVFIMDEESNSSMSYDLALEEGLEGIAKFLAERINKGK